MSVIKNIFCEFPWQEILQSSCVTGRNLILGQAIGQIWELFGLVAIRNIYLRHVSS